MTGLWALFRTNCLEIAASLEFGNLYVLGQVHISKDFIKRKTDLDTYHLTTSRHQFFPIDITDYQSPKQRLPIPHAPKGSDRMAKLAQMALEIHKDTK